MSHRIRCCDRAIIPLTSANDDRLYVARALEAIGFRWGHSALDRDAAVPFPHSLSPALRNRYNFRLLLPMALWNCSTAAADRKFTYSRSGWCIVAGSVITSEALLEYYATNFPALNIKFISKNQNFEHYAGSGCCCCRH
jgi:hypothetical protein